MVESVRKEVRTPTGGERLISVIISVYNRYAPLLRAVLSVVYQFIDEKVELIVIDDASDEDVKKFLMKNLPSETFGLITVLRNSSNRDLAFCRNLGIRRAKGELIAFIDSDDVWLFDRLIKGVSLMKRFDADMVCCNGFWLSGGLVNNIGHDVVIGDDAFILDRFLLLPSGWIVKRSTFEKIGGFDESFVYGWEDGDFLTRAFSSGLRIVFQSEPLVIWDDTGHDRKTNKLRNFVMARFQFLEKNGEILNRYPEYKYRMLRSIIKDAISIKDKSLAKQAYDWAVREFPEKRFHLLSKAIKISFL